MSTPAVWAHIRQGNGPTSRRIDEIVESDSLVLGADGVDAAKDRWRASVLGAGPLDALLTDEAVTDVLVNGTQGVWVDRGAGLERTGVEIGDAAAVRRLAVRLAGLAERRLDEASPFVDGLLPTGVRLHALLPPLVEGAAHLSLRIPRRDAASLSDLERLGAFPAPWAPVLRAIVTSRVSFVIGGGTGAGKTTLLAALLAEVDPSDRLVVVEDVREMAVRHPHVVRLQSRPPNVEGRGSVDMVALVRQSLRMRPDRLVVGEVRGAEVREMLTALNTGHEGGCGTIHANSVADVVPRFEALGTLAGLGPAALWSQLASAIDVVVQVRRDRAGRRIEGIGVLVADADTRLSVLPALRHPEGPHGAAWTDQPHAARQEPGAQEPGAQGPPDSAGLMGPASSATWPGGSPPGHVEPGWSRLAARLVGSVESRD